MKPDYDSIPIHAVKDEVLKILGEGWTVELSIDRARYYDLAGNLAGIYAYFKKPYTDENDNEAMFEASILYAPKYNYSSNSLRDHWEVRIGYNKCTGNFKKPASMADMILKGYANASDYAKNKKGSRLKTEVLDAQIQAEFGKYSPSKTSFRNNITLKDGEGRNIVEFGCYNWELDKIKITEIHKHMTLDRFRRILAILEES